jgi:hypothetical protein
MRYTLHLIIYKTCYCCRPCHGHSFDSL